MGWIPRVDFSKLGELKMRPSKTGPKLTNDVGTYSKAGDLKRALSESEGGYTQRRQEATQQPFTRVVTEKTTGFESPVLVDEANRIAPQGSSVQRKLTPQEQTAKNHIDGQEDKTALSNRYGQKLEITPEILRDRMTRQRFKRVAVDGESKLVHTGGRGTEGDLLTAQEIESVYAQTGTPNWNTLFRGAEYQVHLSPNAKQVLKDRKLSERTMNSGRFQKQNMTNESFNNMVEDNFKSVDGKLVKIEGYDPKLDELLKDIGGNKSIFNDDYMAFAKANKYDKVVLDKGRKKMRARLKNLGLKNEHWELFSQSTKDAIFNKQPRVDLSEDVLSEIFGAKALIKGK